MVGKQDHKELTSSLFYRRAIAIVHPLGTAKTLEANSVGNN